VSSEGKVIGKLWYLKLSKHEALIGDDPSICRYADGHPDFPQESTLDQYFEPAQFRAYRALGCTIGRTIPAASKELNSSTAVSGPLTH